MFYVLDNGGCLAISSQDYLYAKAGAGLTNLMTDYLGIDSADEDLGAVSVLGQAPHFYDSNQPYTLDENIAIDADLLYPDATAGFAFSDAGPQAVQGDGFGIYKDSGIYRTTFLGFPFSSITATAERDTLMGKLLNYCNLPYVNLDPFACSPVTPASIPSTAGYRFHQMWPTLNEPWYFEELAGIAIDPVDKTLFVTDFYAPEVIKLSEDGRVLSRWKGPESVGGFTAPEDLAIDRSGEQAYVYVSDSYYVWKFTPDGQQVPWVDWSTFPAPALDRITGIDVDSSGSVFVADTGNQRVLKFSADGDLLLTLSGAQLLGPVDAAVDDEGLIYVLDSDSSILRFGADGSYIDVLVGNTVLQGGEDLNIHNDLIYVSDSWDKRIVWFNLADGTLAGEFSTRLFEDIWSDVDPVGVAIHPDGSLYITEVIADSEQPILHKYSPQGDTLATWTSTNTTRLKRGWFSSPADIEINDCGHVFVSDNANNRVQVFTADGSYLNEFASVFPSTIEVDPDNRILVASIPEKTISVYDAAYQLTATWNLTNIDAGIADPAVIGIASAVDGRIFVTTGGAGIYVLDSNGGLLEQWTHASTGVDFGLTRDVTVNAAGQVFLTSTNDYAYRFSSTGQYETHWLAASQPGQTSDPHEISLDNEGHVYISDPAESDTILKFSADGTLLATIGGGTGTGPGLMKFVAGHTVAPDGRIFVADEENNRLQVFSPELTEDRSKAIVIAGGGPYVGNHLWSTTQSMANLAYRTFQKQGMDKSQIHYLSGITNADLDGNGLADDIDGIATATTIANAITVWAQGADNIYLYMTDHGGADTFRISETETLSSADLDSWVSTLEAQINGNVTIIYDACESGSFLPIAGTNRRVIASSEPEKPAYFTGRGLLSFSNAFLSSIGNGASIGAAFINARDAVTSYPTPQLPLIDTDGDGSYNEASDDIQALSAVYIGGGVQNASAGPVIGSASIPASITAGSSTAILSASGITDQDGISRVWAVIYPPNLPPSSADNPLSELPTVEFREEPVGSGNYETTWDGFTTPGTYQVVLSATDQLGNNTTLAPQPISAGDPLVDRAILVVGGSSSTDPEWAGYRAAAQAAYSALRTQGYDASQIRLYSTGTFSTPPTEPSAVLGGPTVNGLRDDLTTWAATGTRNLLLYLVGESDGVAFTLNPDSTGDELLHATELDGWLDTVQATLGGKLVTIMDADNAGFFLARLDTPSGMSEKHVRLASTINGNAHFPVDGATSYSRYFWNNIANGAYLPIAHLLAKKAMLAASGGQQQGWLDADSDDVSSKFDISKTLTYSLGPGILLAGDEPILGNAGIDGSSPDFLLWIDAITTTGTLAQTDPVWAMVTPADTDGFGGNDPQPFSVILSPANGRWEAPLEGMNPEVPFTVSFFARDTEGAVSHPLVRTSPDYFETDDIAATAKTILNGNTQHRSLHAITDEDWISFVPGQENTYTFAVDPVGETTDIVLGLQRPDDIAPSLRIDEVPAGDEPLGREELIFTVAPEEVGQPFYLRVSMDQASDIAGEASLYTLSLTDSGGGIYNSTVAGQVRDASAPDGTGWLSGANVKLSFTDPDTSLQVSDQQLTVAPMGVYNLPTPATTVSLEASMSGFQTQTVEPAEPVTANGYLIVNIDLEPAAAEPDDDSDGIPNSADSCPTGITGWTSDSVSDRDGDGCRDSDEDTDDDNDGIADTNDSCPTGITGWASDSVSDRDGDGCRDSDEDTDDDNDGVSDTAETTAGTNPLDANDYPGNADPNHDGHVNAGDMLLCTKIMLGQAAYDARCDMPPPDSTIDAGDLLRIQQGVMGP